MTSLTNVLPPSTQQLPTLLVPTSQPIPLIETPLSKGYSFAYTVGVLLYYYLRAGALVADPLTTLIQDLVPLAIFQSLFCAICLPVAGAWYSGTNESLKGGRAIEGSSSTNKKAGTIPASGSVRRRNATGRPTGDSAVGGPWQTRVMPTILSLILTVAVPPVPLAILALVLGAPLYPTSSIPHTFALALHVALLSFLPIFYTHGVSSTAWRDVAAAWLPFDEAGAWGAAVGTLVGGWVGAIPIALDWDREWQKWPCTVVWGAVLGWAIGRLLTAGLRLGVGSRINLSVSTGQHEQNSRTETTELIDDKKQK